MHLLLTQDQKDAADPSVLSLMAKTDASNIITGYLTDTDKLGLRTLLAQINLTEGRIRHLLGEPISVPATTVDKDVIPGIASPKDSAIAEPLVQATSPSSTIEDSEGGDMELDQAT
jgi:hypothetical protein